MKHPVQHCVVCLLMVFLKVIITSAKIDVLPLEDLMDLFETSLMNKGKLYMLSLRSDPFRIDHAETICGRFGGVLLELDSQDERRFVQRFIQSKTRSWHSDGVFTGYLGPYNDGSYVHQGNQGRLTLNVWDTNEPTNIEGEHCVGIRTNGKLFKYNCSAEARFLCEVDLVSQAIFSEIQFGKLYTLSRVQVPFGLLDAQETCELSNGYLLEIDDMFELNFIKKFLTSANIGYGERVYTAANDLLQRGTFIQFDSKNPFTIRTWYPTRNEPSCVMVNAQGGLFRSDCLLFSRFICEEEMEYQFLSSEKFNNSRHYHLTGRQVIFNNGRAQAKCKSLGGHLLEVDSPEEANFVADFIAKTASHDPTEDRIYTGTNDAGSRGKFRHTHSGKEMKADGIWDSGEPKLAVQTHCVVIKFNGKLATNACGRFKRYICEVASP